MIFLFIILSILLIFLIIVIANKITILKCEKFVNTNSKRILQLKNINKDFQFNNLKRYITIYQPYDNKGNWAKSSVLYYFIYYVRNHEEKFRNFCNLIDYNNKLLVEYKNLIIDTIPDYIDVNTCKKKHLPYKIINKFEKEQFKKILLNPTLNTIFNVDLNYISAKGQVNLHKKEEFDIKKVKDILTNMSSSKRLDYGDYQKLAANERHLLSDKLRYDVLHRDNFKCVLCGRSAKDGAILHIDHIIPISKGGKTEFNNLRVLCEQCNLGKSDTIE